MARLPIETLRISAPEFFNPQSGRLDATRIARGLNMPVTTIAVAIRRKAATVRQHPDGNSLQSELRRIYRIWVTLLELAKGDKTLARQFLNAPNRALGHRAPIELFETGDLASFETYLNSTKT